MKLKFSPSSVILTDLLPQKQGLRLCNFALFYLFTLAHRPTSTKTRIKTGFMWGNVRIGFMWLTDLLPQKQGLRLGYEGYVTGADHATHRPTSTKTRIKTKSFFIFARLRRSSQTYFHKNKD